MVRRTAGCLQCRKRHSRCDGTRPVCRTCQLAKDGRRCSYVSLDIRPSKYATGVGRQILSTADTAARELLLPPRVLNLAIGDREALPAGVRPSRSSLATRWNESPIVVAHARYCRSPLSQGSSHDRDPADYQSHISKDNTGSEVAGDRQRTLSTPRQHGDSPRFVSDPDEAALFDYYVKEAGFWLDAVCPERHFSQIAPRLALSDLMLYSACLAYASLILCSLGKADKTVEEKHSGRAIRLLIDKLSNGSTTWPESSTLTTTVLLRVSEQFSEICDDQQYHLNGAFTLTASTGRVWSSAPLIWRQLLSGHTSG